MHDYAFLTLELLNICHFQIKYIVTNERFTLTRQKQIVVKLWKNES